jgi:carboxymethylenebutenolidase
MVMEDTRELLSTFAHDMRIIGAVGYCMGGRHALLAGGTFPETIKLAGCLHGSNLVNETDASPHKIAARIAGEAYCGFAERDPFGAPSIIAAIESEFRATAKRLTAVIHADAEHGYALPERDVYDAVATRKDWDAIYKLLKNEKKDFESPKQGFCCLNSIDYKNQYAASLFRPPIKLS